MIESTVEIAAASSPTATVAWVETRSCDHTSCAKTVVPSQWAPDGGSGSG